MAGLRGSYSNGESLAIETSGEAPQLGVVDDRELALLVIVYGSVDLGAAAGAFTPGFSK